MKIHFKNSVFVILCAISLFFAAHIASSHPEDVYWSEGFCIPGVDHYLGISDLVVYDGKMVACGPFEAIGCTKADIIAAWDGTAWAPVVSGLNGGVAALAVFDGKLVVGGNFTEVGGVSASYTAMWDGSVWSPLGTGTDGHVRRLAVYDNKLIASGCFTAAGEASAKNIAAWNGSQWSPLGAGIAGYYDEGSPVLDMCVHDNKLIAAGDFNQPFTNIAAWDGSNWLPLGPGLGKTDFCPVSAVTVHNGTLFAGMRFYTTGLPCSPYTVHSWDGSGWSSVGSLTNKGVDALRVFNGALLASTYRSIQAWDGSSWSEFASDIGEKCYPLVEYNNKLTNGISEFDGSSRSYLVSGFDGTVMAFAAHDNKLFVGGAFDHAGDIEALSIASWDGANWADLNTEYDYGLYHPTVSNLASYKGKLIVGGGFRWIDHWGRSIAAWDGANWSLLAPGCTGVHDMIVYDDKLVVGGHFSESALGFPVDGAASWDGSNWASLGTGCDITGLTEYDGTLAACGQFTMPDQEAKARVAIWDNGSWVPAGTGLNTDVFYLDVLALTEWNENLIAACEGQSLGAFEGEGQAYYYCVWAWDGEHWAPMGDKGWDYDVKALTVFNGTLIAGGYFITAAGEPIDHVAAWDPNDSRWGPLGSGTDYRVSTLGIFNNTLMVGGNFKKAGGKASAYVAQWTKRYTSGVTITGLQARAAREGIALSWTINTSEDVYGFWIYRSSDGGATEQCLNDRLVPAAERTYFDKTALPGKRYLYTLAAVSKESGEIRSVPVEAGLTPLKVELFQNSPNPFNPTTTIRYTVPRASRVTLLVYTPAGQLVRTLVDATLSSGVKHVTWDGTNNDGNPVASGVYVYRLQVGKETLAKKMTLLK